MKIHDSSFIIAGLGICPEGVFSYVMSLFVYQIGFFLSWIAAKELYFFINKIISPVILSSFTIYRSRNRDQRLQGGWG